MMHFFSWLGLAAALVPGVVAAQSPHAGHTAPRVELATPDRKDAAAAPGPTTHRSSFEGYRPFNPEEPLVDWRAANEKVRDSAGHMGTMHMDMPGETPAAPAPHAEAHK